MLVVAVASVTLALILYTIGVWAPRKARKLRRWHVVCLWTGFTLDTAGTSLMTILAGGGFKLSVHGLTGATANVLMLALALWATVLLVQRAKTGERNWGQTPYYRGSLILWGLWLVPMALGVALGGRV